MFGALKDFEPIVDKLIKVRQIAKLAAVAH